MNNFVKFLILFFIKNIKSCKKYFTFLFFHKKFRKIFYKQILSEDTLTFSLLLWVILINVIRAIVDKYFRKILT